MCGFRSVQLVEMSNFYIKIIMQIEVNVILTGMWSSKSFQLPDMTNSILITKIVNISDILTSMCSCKSVQLPNNTN